MRVFSLLDYSHSIYVLGLGLKPSKNTSEAVVRFTVSATVLRQICTLRISGKPLLQREKMNLKDKQYLILSLYQTQTCSYHFDAWVRLDLYGS